MNTQNIQNTQKVSLVVSDLFFMVNNKNYFIELENNADNANNVLLENAEEFCYLINKLDDYTQYSAHDIASDFLERL